MARPKNVRSAEDSRADADLRCSVSRIAWLAGVSSQSVTNARAEGTIPKNSDGTMSWPAVRAWAQDRGCWGYGKTVREPIIPIGSAEDYDTTIKRFKAAAAQREHDIAMGKLIPRTDAITAQTRLALEFKASLLGLPEQMSNALANLPPREVERRLRERVNGMLTRSQDGMVPIPAKMVAAIEKLVAEYAGTAAA